MLKDAGYVFPFEIIEEFEARVSGRQRLMAKRKRRKVKCPHCERVFNGEAAMYQHMRESHDRGAPISHRTGK